MLGLDVVLQILNKIADKKDDMDTEENEKEVNHILE